MLNTAVQLMLFETCFLFCLPHSPPQGATKKEHSKLRSHMISLGLLNLVEFRLLCMERSFVFSKESGDPPPQEKLIEILFSP